MNQVEMQLALEEKPVVIRYSYVSNMSCFACRVTHKHSGATLALGHGHTEEAALLEAYNAIQNVDVIALPSPLEAVAMGKRIAELEAKLAAKPATRGSNDSNPSRLNLRGIKDGT